MTAISVPASDLEPRHSVSMGAAVMEVRDLGAGRFAFSIAGRRVREMSATAADVAHLVWMAGREFFGCPMAAEWWLMNRLGDLETELRARDPDRVAA